MLQAGSQNAFLHIQTAPIFPAQLITRTISVINARVEEVIGRHYGASTDYGRCCGLQTLALITEPGLPHPWKLLDQQGPQYLGFS